MDVQTSHAVYAFGPDQMILFDNATAQAICTATRSPGGTQWTIHADGIADITANSRGADDPQPRADVVQAMADHALAAVPETGISTLVPHGLSEMP